jgi:hypothetical protein
MCVYMYQKVGGELNLPEGRYLQPIRFTKSTVD